MLEQLLLRMRRAGLVLARRGRSGGYRLAKHAALIPVGEVLAAAQASGAAPRDQAGQADSASDQVTQALEQRLQRAIRRSLDALSLEELLFDLRSAQASLDGEGGLLLG